MQSEEARLKFDKEPGHDKLKASVLVVRFVDEQTVIQCRRRQIRCWSRSLYTTTPRRTILVGEWFEAVWMCISCITHIPRSGWMDSSHGTLLYLQYILLL